MDGKDIPIDADGGVVPTLGLFENFPGLPGGQAGANLFDIVDVPGNLDGIGEFAASAHGVSSCVETADSLQPMRTGNDGASGRRGCPLPALAAGHIRKAVCALSRATASVECGGFRAFRDGVQVASLRLQTDAGARGEATRRLNHFPDVWSSHFKRPRRSQSPLSSRREENQRRAARGMLR